MDEPIRATPRWRQMVWQPIVIELVAGLLVSMGLLAVFAYFAEEVIEGERLAFDTQVIDTVRAWAAPWLMPLMIALTRMGEWWFMAGVGLVAGWAWWRAGQRGKVIILVTTALGGAALNQLLKLVFHRTRPDELGRLVTVNGYSFPSGHAQMSFCFYVILVFLLVYGRPSWLRFVGMVGALALVGMIGLSRIYLGVHYPSDVVGGFAAAAVWVLTNILAYRWYYHHRPAV